MKFFATLLAAVAVGCFLVAPAAAAAPPSPAAGYMNKVGFHLGPGGDHDGVMTYLQTLDAKGIPFVIKDVDEYGTLKQAAAMAEKSGVEHVIVWRSTSTDTVNYNNDPVQEAQSHWKLVMSKLPDGFDKQRVWLEIINEPDQAHCDWLGQFSVASANLSMAAGFKTLMLGFATGNPFVGAGGGPMCWNQTHMAEYLRLAAAHPDTLGVALHEYALSDTITNEFPYLLGRFHFLFDVCDQLGIPHPTVMFTEWGWQACSVHLPPSEGMKDVDQIMRGTTFPYAKYPSIKGAFTWYLGPWSCPISSQADQLVLPMLNYTISTYGK